MKTRYNIYEAENDDKAPPQKESTKNICKISYVPDQNKSKYLHMG